MCVAYASNGSELKAFPVAIILLHVTMNSVPGCRYCLCHNPLAIITIISFLGSLLSFVTHSFVMLQVSIIVSLAETR